MFDWRVEISLCRISRTVEETLEEGGVEKAEGGEDTSRDEQVWEREIGQNRR
jgi:hypothetical protein